MRIHHSGVLEYVPKDGRHLFLVDEDPITRSPASLSHHWHGHRFRGACNPKTLVGLMKSLTAYFDQLAGSYPLIRKFIHYINTEFLANNMLVAFPMQSNQYSIGSPVDTAFADLFSRFIELESRSLLRTYVRCVANVRRYSVRRMFGAIRRGSF
eukprot:SAG31_NODE_790_length_12082_cov_8.754319_1_plen_154_part_00